jgi:hypothetical protein
MDIIIPVYKLTHRYSLIKHQCQLAAMERVSPYAQYNDQQQDPYYPVTIPINSLAETVGEPKELKL